MLATSREGFLVVTPARTWTRPPPADRRPPPALDEWRDLPSWPPPGYAPAVWHLHAGGALLSCPLERDAAHIAGSASFPSGRFAKMQANLAMPAARLLHKAAQRVVTLPGALAFRRILQLLHEMRQ